MKYVKSIIKQCPQCGEYTLMRLTKVQADQYKKCLETNKLIQEVCYDMSPEEREFVITGMCPKCVQEIFSEYYKPAENFLNVTAEVTGFEMFPKASLLEALQRFTSPNYVKSDRYRQIVLTLLNQTGADGIMYLDADDKLCPADPDTRIDGFAYIMPVTDDFSRMCLLTDDEYYAVFEDFMWKTGNLLEVHKDVLDYLKRGIMCDSVKDRVVPTTDKNIKRYAELMDRSLSGKPLRSILTNTYSDADFAAANELLWHFKLSRTWRLDPSGKVVYYGK